MEEKTIQIGSVEYEELLMKTKGWRILYPIYFDKEVSRANGRKVPKELAVDTPDIDEIARVLQHFKIPFFVEINKKHPRDFFCIGRVKYTLKDDETGELINPEIPNKWALYKKLGELMPKLKNRTVKHRTDNVKIKPGVGYGGKKVKKIKAGKKRRRR